MPRYFKVPEERKDEPGMFVGGAFVPFKDGVAEQPDGIDWSWAFKGFTEVNAPQAPEALPAEVAPDAQEAPAKPAKAKG